MNLKNKTERTLGDLVEKQERLRQESIPIDTKIRDFTAVAWTCIILGFTIALLPLIFPGTSGYSEYGDFFGGPVTGLWSLGGIFFIYVAFLGQKQQLLNQQIEIIQNQVEMRATQSELEGQKEQLQIQNKLFKQQQFETTFFNLLSDFNETVRGFKYYEAVEINDKSELVLHEGKDAFKWIFHEFKNIYTELSESKKKADEVAIVEEAYIQILTDFEGTMYNYLRGLISLLSFIDRSYYLDTSFYLDLTKDQITPTELVLLFYFHYFNRNGRSRQPFIKYSIFNRISREILLKGEHLEIFSLKEEEE